MKEAGISDDRQAEIQNELTWPKIDGTLVTDNNEGLEIDRAAI